MKQFEYQIYPSIIDSYFYYKQNENEEKNEELFFRIIDKINKKPQPQSEAAARGEEFKQLLDGMTKPASEDYVMKDGTIIPYEVLNELFVQTAGSVKEVFLARMLPTKYGNVRLYGFVDNLKQDMVLEVKTTSRYEFGKYEESCQRYAYPFVVGDDFDCSMIRFLVTDFKSVYHEDYTPTPNDVPKLVSMVEEFIDFLNLPHVKALITNPKFRNE